MKPSEDLPPPRDDAEAEPAPNTAAETPRATGQAYSRLTAAGLPEFDGAGAALPSVTIVSDIGTAPGLFVGLQLCGATVVTSACGTALMRPGDVLVDHVVVGQTAGIAADRDADSMDESAPRLRHLDKDARTSSSWAATEILRYTRAHLSDNGLTPVAIASAHHIQVGHLHRILASEGISLLAWMRTQRLEECRKALSRPAALTLTIESIARSWGFTDMSGFRHNFKSTYGLLPGEWRKRHATSCEAGRQR